MPKAMSLPQISHLAMSVHLLLALSITLDILSDFGLDCKLFFRKTEKLERVILKAEEIKTIFLLYFFNLNKGRGLKNGKILIFDI